MPNLEIIICADRNQLCGVPQKFAVPDPPRVPQQGAGIFEAFVAVHVVDFNGLVCAASGEFSG